MKEKAKILVVEAERIVAEDIRRSLENGGYTVSAIVPSGEEAIEKIKELEPDLVMTEIVLLGKLDGIETTEKIRSSFDIPVVYLTSLADPKTVERIKKSRPSGYILKPFEDRELRDVVDTAMDRYRYSKKKGSSPHS